MAIKKRKKVILIGFAVLIGVSIIAFTLSSFIIARKSNDAISSVGEIYTHAMAEQMKQAFDAVISMQVFQVQGIMERTPPETISDRKEMIDELSESARVRSFTHLALYTEDGEQETIYGEPVDYYVISVYFPVIAQTERKCCVC